MSDEALFNEYFEALRLIQPKLNRAQVVQWRVHRDIYAQPVCTRGFSKLVPAFAGPLPNLFILESSQLYPADRNLSGALAQANKVKQLVLSGLEKG
jgi:protoporphyrinogen oxidase